MKVIFVNEPRLQPVGSDVEWRLTARFIVRIEEPDKRPPLQLIVPKGFRTDLASVPRLPGAYLVFANRGRRSAILHDYLYFMRYERAWADAVFRAALVNEVGALPRFFMWLGVRLGGASRYKQLAPATQPQDPSPWQN